MKPSSINKQINITYFTQKSLKRRNDKMKVGTVLENIVRGDYVKKLRRKEKMKDKEQRILEGEVEGKKVKS